MTEISVYQLLVGIDVVARFARVRWITPTGEGKDGLTARCRTSLGSSLARPGASSLRRESPSMSATSTTQKWTTWPLASRRKHSPASLKPSAGYCSLAVEPGIWSKRYASMRPSAAATSASLRNTFLVSLWHWAAVPTYRDDLCSLLSLTCPDPTMTS